LKVKKIGYDRIDFYDTIWLFVSVA
jgi:hypothetical protein